MRAALVRELNAPLTVEEIELRAPGAGEARVRIEARSFCITDALAMGGFTFAEPPFISGHSAVGVVEEVGEGSPRRRGRAASRRRRLDGVRTLLLVRAQPARRVRRHLRRDDPAAPRGHRCIRRRHHERAGRGLQRRMERPDSTVTPSAIDFAISGKRMLSSQTGGSHIRRDVPRFTGMLARGEIDAAPIVTRLFGLEEINDAVAAARAREVLTGVIVPG
jgi:Zn-dependent alcohol dehydrogenase